MRSAILLLGLSVGACGSSPKGGDGSSSSSSGDASSSSGEAGDSSTDPPTTGGPIITGGDASTGDVSSTGSATTTSTTDASTSDGSSDTTGAAACTASLAAGDHTIELMHAGIKRSALVHVPAGLALDVPAPLVLNFHGYLMNPAQQADFSGMTAKSDAAGFLLAYPGGTDSSWNAGTCCGNAVTKNVDDVGFVRALVAELHDQLCIDPKRIYSTGMSNGGFLSNRLACEAADLFAAVAPVSSVNGMARCTPSRPIPVLMFNGTADILVNYNGNANYISAPQTFADWAERNVCVGPPVAGAMNGASSCETQDSCDDGVQVTLCTLEGMGHCWPGQPTCLFGTPNTDLSANDMMWEFFSQHALP